MEKYQQLQQNIQETAKNMIKIHEQIGSWNQEFDAYRKNDIVINEEYKQKPNEKEEEAITRAASYLDKVKGIIERKEILDKYASGEIEVLTSMKCLDEGVDVPRSEMAIFCASTGNPRQFIQRRGRILRKHPDKHMAIIHDLVVAPEISSAQENYNMERSLIRSELKRVRDFAVLSENADYAYNELNEILSYYNISLF